jgi:hypothetical protein
LQQVGAALDDHRPLRVHQHGRVEINDRSSANAPAMENGDERQGKRRSPTRSRKRTAGRQRASCGSRPSGAAPRVGGSDLQAAYQDQVTAISEAYPSLQTFADKDGMWLLATSSIIPGLAREATFLVALPYQPSIRARAWGFWTAAKEARWIGPRHTNFADGSICAFSSSDGVWREGESLTTLLDLYSVWSLRHLFLETFGRWPGKQYGLPGADYRTEAYYRLKECLDDELCACGSETRRYAECCKLFDSQRNILELIPIFLRQTGGGLARRRPPDAVLSYIEGRTALPGLAEICSVG